MSVAHISGKQEVSAYHDTPEKQSNEKLWSSHFGNKETRIKKLNPFVVLFIQ